MVKMCFQPSKCRHLLGASPQTSKYSALWNNQKGLSVGLHVICHQLRPDYDPTPFIKAMPRNLSEMTENSCEICWNLMFKTSICLAPDPQWISNDTRPNQKWNEINENVREMLCYVCLTSSASAPRFCPHPIHKGFASKLIRSGKKLTPV